MLVLDLSDYETWCGVLGRHGTGKVNKNGIRLLSFCNEFGLCITNTLFQQPNRYVTTWMHPRSKDWHLLDNVIVRQRHVKDVYHTRSHRNTGCWSDHLLVRGTFSLSLSTKRRRSAVKIPKIIDISKLKLQHKRQDLEISLDNAMDNVIISDNVEASWKSLKEATYSSSVEELGFPT